MDIPTKQDDERQTGNHDNLRKHEGFHMHQKIMEEIHNDEGGDTVKSRDHNQNKAELAAPHDSGYTSKSISGNNENYIGGHLDVDSEDDICCA